MVGMVSIELAMFMRWMEDNCRRMLTPPEALNIARKILDRENYKCTEENLFAITTLATASDIGQIDEFRKKTSFDKTIDGFCKSIGINKPS